MKAIVFPLTLIAAAAGLVAMKPNGEVPPPGTEAKIREILPGEPYAKPGRPRRMLVFSRTNGFRHASIATGKVLLEELGKNTGAYQVVISEDPEEFEQERLRNYDAVCFLSTTGNPFLPDDGAMKSLAEGERSAALQREARLKENLMNHVKNGGGFIGIHAATDTCYEWKDYGRMINGYFDGHPWTAGTPVSIRVEPGQEKHPLVAMLGGENLEFREEIYQLKDPYDSKSVHMLLRLDTGKTDMTLKGIRRRDHDFGVSWIRNWGKGRVFYCSIGHNHEMYWNPKVVRHYLAGIQWALGDLEVPVQAPQPD